MNVEQINFIKSAFSVDPGNDFGGDIQYIIQTPNRGTIYSAEYFFDWIDSVELLVGMKKRKLKIFEDGRWNGNYTDSTDSSADPLKEKLIIPYSKILRIHFENMPNEVYESLIS